MRRVQVWDVGGLKGLRSMVLRPEVYGFMLIGPASMRHRAENPETSSRASCCYRY